MLALVLVTACGSSAKKSTPSTPTVPTRIDSQLVFGGTTECLQRPLCLGDKEKQLYGFNFKEVKKLDAGGPITSKALRDNTIQVGLLFTGSSVIDPNFVLLNDDKGLQPADNPTALVRESKATGEVRRILDEVNAKLTIEAYNKMADNGRIINMVTTQVAVTRPSCRNTCTAGPDTSATRGAGTSSAVISSSGCPPGTPIVAVTVTSSPSKQRAPDSATVTSGADGRRRGISASAPRAGAASRTRAACPVRIAASSPSSAAVARFAAWGEGCQPVTGCRAGRARWPGPRR